MGHRSVPESELLAPIYNMMWTTIGIAAIVAVIALIIVFFLMLAEHINGVLDSLLHTIGGSFAT